MLKVGQVERTEITGYSSEGMGICRIDGCAVFVPNAIRGELCEIKVTHVSRNSAHGKIEQIIERSPHRITRTCPDAKRCGGCQLHHMDYAEELAFKAQKVTDALNRIGGQNIPLVKINGADGTVRTQDAESVPQKEGAPAAAFAYRNKAQYPMAEQEGKPVAGFYKNRTHEVIPVKRCAILPEIFDRVRDVVIRWAAEDRVSVYNEHSGKGLLRHIYVRKGTVSGQLMVCLVVNGQSLPREQRLVNALRREIPGLASVVLSVNTKNTNVVLGEEIRTLWGEPFIEDQLCGFTFRLSPHSFYQVNHDQAQRLYAKAAELAALHGTESVLDIYCGTGTITLALSREAGRAIGVEVIPQAIEDAKENALRNGVQNVEFFCADAGEAAQRFASQASGIRDQASGIRHQAPGIRDQASGIGDQGSGIREQAFGTGELGAEIRVQASITGDEKAVTGHLSPVNAHGSSPDVILVDPPRKGLAPEVIDAVVTMAPKRIVYVSCDPATLARDVKLFSERGYSLSHAEAFDLFPRTFHVETVVSLSQLKSDV